MKRLTSVLVAITLIAFPVSRPAKANPAVLAPMALCAGTAGVGCVLIGVAVVGGISYYIWQNSNGRKFTSDATGKILTSEYLKDPETEDEGVWEDPLDTRNLEKARQVCRSRAKNVGASFDLRQDPATGKWVCILFGGTGR